MEKVLDGENSSFKVEIKTDITQKYITNITDSYENAKILLAKYEGETSLRFATWLQSKDFGCIDIYKKNHKILWEDEIFSFTGIPFIILGSKVLDCRYGKDRNICAKRRRTSINSDNPYKYPNSLRTTKKLDCPAQVHIKEIVHFPDFKIDSFTKWKKERGSKRLRLAIKDRALGSFKRSFIVLIPEMTSHYNHPNEVTEQRPRCVHKRKTSSSLPKPPKKRPINRGPGFRKLLDEIKALSYLVEDDGELIKDLYTNIEHAKNFLISVIKDRGSENTNIVESIDDVSKAKVENQIVVARSENNENDEYERTPDSRQNTVIVRRDSCNDEEQQVTDLGEKEVHIYLESEATVEETANNLIKVITINPTNQVVESPHVVVEDAEDLLDKGHGNLNPQEYQALTNMLHVLLEENKVNESSNS